MKEQIKQMGVKTLRSLKILSFADRIRMQAEINRSSKDNIDFVRSNEAFNCPPHDLMYDAYSHTSYRQYYESGKTQAEYISALIKKHIQTDNPFICEWGCGPARIIQHLKLFIPQAQVFGTDYNNNSINWCQKTYPDIIFKKNNLSPPLPLEDSSLDVLYCISVFTHLSELQHYRWVNEILRVLKPGGLFIGSFHSEESKNKLLNQEKEKFENGLLVSRGRVVEGSRLFVSYQSEKFLTNSLFVGFSKYWKDDTTLFGQTVWCCKK